MGWLASASAALVALSAAPLLGETANGSDPATQDLFGDLTDPEDLSGNIDVLSLSDERYSRLTVPVTIGGRGPFAFLIDTGAQATVLSRELADRLGLFERQTATLVGMASRADTETVALSDFALGSRSYHIALAPLIEQRHLGMADGILGVDSLQDQRVLLDFAANTLSVADAKEQGGDRGFEIVVKARRKLGQLVITQAEIDGVRTAVIVDTGAQGSMGNLALGRKLRGRDLGPTAMTDINGFQIEGQSRLAGILSMDRVQIRNFPIAFADAAPFRVLGLEDEPALILGIEELKLFERVAIDFAARKVLFDIADRLRPRARPATNSYRF